MMLISYRAIVNNKLKFRTFCKFFEKNKNEPKARFLSSFCGIRIRNLRVCGYLSFLQSYRIYP